MFGLPADAISAYATLAAAIIAVFALTAAIRQIKISKREARLTLAKTIYKDYLMLAFQNPEFSFAAYPQANPRMNNFKKHGEYDKYEIFVSYLLLAAEEILDITKNDIEWRATLRDQLKYHGLYLDGMDLPENHYSSALLTLREEAVKEYQNEDARS